MKASKAQIKYFKGVIVPQVQEALRKGKTFMALEQVSDLLKLRAELNKSCEELEDWEMEGLILESITFGEELGIQIKLPSERGKPSEFPYWD